ncbi:MULTISPECIES: helix-turn-helix domain-containing protein [Segatella]|uniref:Transcriptional regulator, AraC family n=2 Tax=Segatella TaxID=2974251 RepID=D8DV94_9BACT|nr:MULTISPECIES: helix-turn-helix domain-containing protein [Segatella]EFI72646.1 transcriptional regulator, AraC family [Segatella baroniae B14]UKK79187.1 helix-turn-helix domain-containing protein [Segatella baroniae B14]GJG28500.1 transcriptional regulator [Segatella bryantii]SER01166.1 Helix-turn-helix domain-containing protein [Segatella baroniae B14]
MVKREYTFKDKADFMEKIADIDGVEFFEDDFVLINNVKFLEESGTQRIDGNVICFIVEGKMQAEVNGETLFIHDNQVLILPTGITLGNIMVSPDIRYFSMGISNRMLKFFLGSYMNVWNQFTYVQKIRIVNAEKYDENSSKCFDNIFKHCLNKTDDEIENGYRREIFKSMMRACLLSLCNAIRKQADVLVDKPHHHASYFNLFLELLEHAEIKHQTVEHYASELCISTKYLAQICKKNSGKTPNQWITEYTLADITHYLQNTEMSMKQISNAVGFPNTSFFGKYVKKHLGCTPIEFRNKK